MREYMRIMYVVAEGRDNIESLDGHVDIDKALAEIEMREKDRRERLPSDAEPWKLYKVVETRDVIEIPYNRMGLT